MSSLDEIVLFFQPQEINLELIEKKEFSENREDSILYFSNWVEDLHSRGLTYIESINNFVKYHDMDEDDVVKYITPSMKYKTYQECIELNMIKHINDYDQPVLF